VKRLLQFVLLLLPAGLWAQGANTITRTGAGAPAGGCSFIQFYVDSSNGDMYNCVAAAWHKIGGSSSSPLTTKGDLWGFSTLDARVGVGSDGQCLKADSTAPLGVSYSACGGSATAGGSDTQIQFNDATALGGIPSVTYIKATPVFKVQAGTKFSLTDTADTTKVAQFDISSIATGTTRTFIFPNAGGTFVLTSRTLNTTSPITGGGDLSSDRTIACATCATTTNGGALSGTAPITLSAGGAIAVTSHGGTARAQLSDNTGTSGNYAKFAVNGDVTDGGGVAVITTRNVNTTSPITGGGDLSADRTIACASCVTASSPGAGIAHFAGSTQAVTSSAVTSADTTGTFPPNAHNLLSASHGDTTAAAATVGDIISGQAGPTWARLAGSTLSAGGGFLNSVESVLSAPSAPTLTVSATGGTITQASGTTVYVVITLVNAFGETVGSTETSIAVSTGNGCTAAATTCSVNVPQPTLSGNATGYTVYDSIIAGNERQQTVSGACINVTGTCVVGTVAVGTTIPPSVNTASSGTVVAPAWASSTGSGAVVTQNSATINPKLLDGIRVSDKYPGSGTAAHMDEAAIDIGTGSGGTILIPASEANGIGAGASTSNTNLNLIDLRTGSLSTPTSNKNWTHPGFQYQCYDNSASTTDSNAQADANAAPCVRFESVESGAAVVPPLYLYGVGLKGSTGVQYSILGKTQVYPGWRGATVANNIVMGLNAAYDITNIVEASAGQIVATVADNSTPTVFGGATTHNCQIGDVAHISAVTDTYYNTASVGYSVTAVAASTVTMSIGSATHAASSGGTLLCKNYQTFVFESNLFNNDVNQNQDLTPTMEQNLNATWGHTVTSSGAYPITSANYVAGANQYYGMVTQDAIVAGERLGYYKSGAASLGMTYGTLHDQRNIAVNGTNYASIPSGFHASYWNGASATDAWVSENAQPDAGTSPIVRHTFSYCTGGYNCAASIIHSINSDGTTTNYGNALPSATNSWSLGSTTVGWSAAYIGSAPPACTAGTAGMWCAAEGTNGTNVSGAALINPNSTTHEFAAFTNGSTSAGMLLRAQPGAIHVTGQTATKTIYTLCAASAGACNTAGQYAIDWYFNQGGTACSSVTAGSVTFALTWTDNAGAHSAVALPMNDQLSTTATSTLFHFTTSNTTAWASGHFNIWSTGAAAIQITNTYTACTTGTGTWELAATATRMQ
jgi:hypothetical protein